MSVFFVSSTTLATCSVHKNLVYFIMCTALHDLYTAWSSLMTNALNCLLAASLLHLNMLKTTMFLDIFNVCATFWVRDHVWKHTNQAPNYCLVLVDPQCSGMLTWLLNFHQPSLLIASFVSANLWNILRLVMTHSNMTHIFNHKSRCSSYCGSLMHTTSASVGSLKSVCKTALETVAMLTPQTNNMICGINL